MLSNHPFLYHHASEAVEPNVRLPHAIYGDNSPDSLASVDFTMIPS